jgi:hypothetical protein
MMPMREQPNMHITPLDVYEPVAGYAVRVSNCVDCTATQNVASPSFGATVARGEKGCERLRMPDSRLETLTFGSCAQREAHLGRFVAVATRRTHADADNHRAQLEFERMRAAQSREPDAATEEPPYDAFGTHTRAPIPPLS